MIFSVEINNQIYRINSDQPLDISIPLDFNGAQPNAYGVEKARSKACETGALVGDTRRGGSCNFEKITMIPHCNGTHTESIGHITHERISVRECLRESFIPATLVSLEPENAFEIEETYSIRLSENDRLITRKSVEKALKNADDNFLSGLIVRTLPNDADKLTRAYLERIPPFFSSEAMEFIASKRIGHLLVDVPSIDRIYDEGKLANHRAFWNIETGSYELNADSFPHRTITEMIYVPDEIADGAYVLNLQIAPLIADASPSRPILFKIDENLLSG